MRTCIALLAISLAAAACGTHRDADPRRSAAFDLVIGFWNVENLFDADDDPANPGDDEYLPEHGWDAARYGRKLDRLGTVIAAVEPHVLGLAEVENRRVLEDLVAHERLRHFGFHIAHVDSPDKRGIDTALICRAPFTVAATSTLRVEKDGERPTRDILEVLLRDDAGRELVVFVNHWPSRGGDRDGAFRCVAAGVLRARIDELGHDRDVVVVGDLNDDPFDRSVRNELGAVRSRNAVVNRRNATALFNPSWSVLGRIDDGTLYYNREWVWNVFDQAIVSRGMLDGAGFDLAEARLHVHGPDELRDEYRRPLRFRQNRGDGSWSEGFSDHFLVFVRVRTP